MLGQPTDRSVDDDQADHEKGDAGKDLGTALLRLGGDIAGRREEKNEAERVQAIAEPVRLGSHEREEWKQRRRSDVVAHVGGAMIAMGIAAAAPTAVPIAFRPIRSRLPIRTYKARSRIDRDPVGLAPPQCHADRRCATQDRPEHERHDCGVSGADPLAFDDGSGSESAGQHDAVACRYCSDDPIGRRLFSRRHWAGEGRHERDHQQRKPPSEPDPGSRDDAGRGEQTHPPPVVGGEGPKRRR